MVLRPPSSTLFPTRRSSDLVRGGADGVCVHADGFRRGRCAVETEDRKSTRLNSSHSQISYAVFCLKKKKSHTSHREARLLPNPSRVLAMSHPTPPRHRLYRQ